MFNTNEITTLEDLLLEANSSKYQYKTNQIELAYAFASKVHEGAIRKSGAPLLTHLLTTAAYVMRLTLDTTSVVAALLHETLENGEVTLDQLDEEFGTDVAFIISGLTNLKDSTSTFKLHNESPKNFSNLILNATEDIRILIIRLANKLHNLQTWKYLTPERQLNQAHKTMYVYAPLCKYLGLGNFLEIFEEQAFSYLHPEEFSLIKKTTKESVFQNEGLLDRARVEILTLLESGKVQVPQLQLRSKNLLSIYKKILSKHLLPGEQLTVDHIHKIKDLFGIRFITENVEQCYIALGLLHTNYNYDQEEFDDYILRPKESGYKSIHTVIDFENTTIEIQIRTEEMHEYNEFGPASHILYKQKKLNLGEDMTWTKDLIIWQGEEHKNKEKFKVRAFANMIFVFTPDGKIIKLDSSSTCLDFAFHVHTDIGYHYNGAIVNGTMRSMEHQLKTGDIIEILTSSQPTVNWSWLHKTEMNYSKSRIRKKLKPQI